jgi:hypothetical protein
MDGFNAIVIHGKTIPQMADADWDCALAKPEV